MKLAGYLFNGRFYKDENDLRGKTMSDGNEPVPVYFREEKEISKDEELIEKFKHQLDTATPNLNRPYYQSKKCAKIATKHFTEKVKSLHNKYDRGEVGGIYNLAIFDVLEILK